MTALVFVVAVLATYRVTLLVAADEITSGPRDRLVRWLNEGKHGPYPQENPSNPYRATDVLEHRALWEQTAARDPHKLAFLVGCPWCASPYVGLVVIACTLAWGGTDGWWLVAGTLAASGVTGALASKATP